MNFFPDEYVLVTCHGFTGYPEEMAPIGLFFQERGYQWKNIQTNEEDLRNYSWGDWANCLTDMVHQEIENDRKVIVAGLSMGGMLSLYALENIPEISAGIIMATPTKINNNVKELHELAKNVRQNLYKIRQPLFIAQSIMDSTVSPKNALDIYHRTYSQIKQLLMVNKSGHVLTRDYDAKYIFDRAFQFIEYVNSHNIVPYIPGI